MFRVIIVLVALQFAALANANVKHDVFPEMAMAMNDPANFLVTPNRLTTQAANPEFATSDSTYWLVDYTYSGASCTSNVVLKFGVATGYCFQTGGASSLKYTCTSELSCTVTLYSDTTCVTSTNVIPFNLGVCSVTDADDDGYLTDDGGAFTKQQTLAVKGYPTAFSDSNSGIMSYYVTQTCMQSSMYVYRVGYENHCYSNYDGTDYTSTKYTNANLYEYTEKSCLPTNVVQTVSVPTGFCQINSATTSQKMNYYKKDSGDSLSAGAIAGIVIGSVAAVAIVAALVFFFVFKAKAPMAASGSNNV